MLPSKRIDEIRRLQLSVAQRERQHAPRDRQRAQLKMLVVRQLQHEILRDRFESLAGAVAFAIFAFAVFMVIP